MRPRYIDSFTNCEGRLVQHGVLGGAVQAKNKSSKSTRQSRMKTAEGVTAEFLKDRCNSLGKRKMENT